MHHRVLSERIITNLKGVLFYCQKKNTPSTLHYRLAGIIGNVIKQYDHALFGLSAPFLAPLFFHTGNPITELLLTYAIMPLGILIKPIGSIFFGWIGDHFGRRKALFWSLTGMGVATGSIGCLPTYETAGCYAPVFLAILKMTQSFFAAGEAKGGAIFMIEHTQKERRTFASALYGVSSIAGILIASLLICISEQEWWRYLFWLGGIVAFIGLYLRFKTEETEEFCSSNSSLIAAVKTEKRAFITILLACGFSHITYSFSFNFMNGFIPLISSISRNEMMQINSALLLLDMLLLPCFALLATKIGKEKLMKIATLGLAIIAVPLFFSLLDASLATAIFVRISIMTLGVAFAAPYYAWAVESVKPESRYRILSLASSLGSQLIGASSSAVPLFLYYQTGYIVAPGVYLMLAALATAAAIVWSEKKDGSISQKVVKVVFVHNQKTSM